MKFVLSLCDNSGIFVEPWVKNGYRALLVDILYPKGVTYEDRITKFGCDLSDSKSISDIIDLLDGYKVVFVSSFPPCTDLAISGAKWFEDKRSKNPDFQEEAMHLVYNCRDIAEHFNVPYFIENPVGVISTMWRKPDYIFHPWHYTLHCKRDNYKKKTCLWTNKLFIMPPKAVDKSLGQPDDRIHKCPPSKNRGLIRSVTPLGFSRAVYHSNKDVVQ